MLVLIVSAIVFCFATMFSDLTSERRRRKREVARGSLIDNPPSYESCNLRSPTTYDISVRVIWLGPVKLVILFVKNLNLVIKRSYIVVCVWLFQYEKDDPGSNSEEHFKWLTSLSNNSGPLQSNLQSSQHRNFGWGIMIAIFLST